MKKGSTKSVKFPFSRELTRAVLNEVCQYLEACDIYVPQFKLTIHRKPGGSSVKHDIRDHLNLGCYPTRFMTEWWVMHEMGHILWNYYSPCDNRKFAQAFGAPQPEDYDDIHRKYSPFSTLAETLRMRPENEPSPYGAKAGGEERFCELLGLMYASGGFDQAPPEDLEKLWNVCWHSGLADMV